MALLYEILVSLLLGPLVTGLGDCGNENVKCLAKPMDCTSHCDLLLKYKPSSSSTQVLPVLFSTTKQVLLVLFSTITQLLLVLFSTTT